MLDNLSISINSYGTDISNKVLYYSCKFLEMERMFNSKNMYNFGIIPYYLYQKLMKGVDVIEYINKETSEDIVLNYKYKLLLLNILLILCNRNINLNDIEEYITTFEHYEISLNAFNKYIHSNNINNSHDIKCILKSIYDKNDSVNGFAIEMNIINLCLQHLHVNEMNVYDYEDIFNEYFSMAEYIVKNENIFNNEYDELKNNIELFFENSFNELKTLTRNNSINNSQEIAKIIGNINRINNVYPLYIYTSLLIYNPVTNKRIDNNFVYLVSNVYDDIINYFIYNSLVNNSIIYSESSWNEWNSIINNLKDVNKVADNVYVIKTELIGKIIDSEYVIVKDYNDNLVNNLYNLQIIYKAFNNNCYYHNTTEHFNLYSVYDGNLILINIDNNRCNYHKTILKSYIYANTYIDLIGSVNNNRIYKNNILGIVNTYNSELTMYNHSKIDTSTFKNIACFK